LTPVKRKSLLGHRLAELSRREEVEVQHGHDGVHRILVVTHIGVDRNRLSSVLQRHQLGASNEAHILLPVLTKRSQRFTGDLDEEIRASERDVESLVAALGDLPGTVTGAIGDADPRLAVADTLRTFQADEVITMPPPAAELNALKISPPDEVFKGVRLPVTVVQDSARPRTD
jgi:hypothetical protein